ncbi:Ig-like domain-containing protein [Clostridium lundense]|uniref:Ig-like domain-containing protein n=1 Tax=Clostridium lundense TaxID=319475 RepID=UPI0006853466|nr:Ig-like domain-containing protein [Clostridium lundense]
MKRKCKNIISFLLTFLMFLSSFNIGILKDYKVFAAENNIKVKVRIEANDHTIISEREIEVSNFDLKAYGAAENSKDITAAHAIIKALESENVDCKDTNKFNSNGCTFIDNIVSVKQGLVCSKDGWMYYINNNYAPDYINKVNIKNGDNVVVFFQEDYEKNTYSYFDKSVIKVKTGENINLKLLGSKYDVNTNESKEVGISDAKILVDNKDYIVNGKYINTDKEGNVTFTFDKEGTYEISAVRFDKDTKRRDISRPYCKVVVKKGEGIVDKTSLVNSIDEGEKILNTAQIGSGVGEYSQEAKDLLQKSIEEVKSVLNKEGLTIDELNAANTKLQNEILKFKESINKDESLQNVIDSVVSYYATWKDNSFKSLDFITSMALRRAGVDTDKLLSKVNIYGMDGLHNNARNVMNIIGVGKNPKNYRDKDYTKFLIDYNYDKEDTSEYIAKAIIAMDMAEIEYNKEKVVGALLSKAHDEGDGKVSFGSIIPGDYDEWTGETSEDEYTPYIEHTAWSLIALSNHKDIKNSKEVIEGIKKYLKFKQDKNGLIENSSDTALTIQGLICLEEDPKSDYWCVKDGDKKISMVDGMLKCKKDNQFMLQPNSGMVSDLATAHVLAALVDLNTMTSMYRKLKYEDVSVPVKVQIYGEKEVYNGGKLNLEAKAFDYNNVVIKNAAISWKSSDEKIATVKNGVVQALKEGELEITAYITGSEGIKDSIKIKITTPPQIDYSDRLNKEIEFLKNHYMAYGKYEFLASPGAVLSGVDKNRVKENIYRYSKNSTALQVSKTIIALLGAGLDPKNDNVKDEKVNHIEVLEKAQVSDGINKGKFIVNEAMDQNSIETQAYCIITLDLVDGKYDKESAIKALLNMLNDSNYKETDSSYKYIKTEAVAVTALSKHKDISGVENKINELITFFKENQNEDGAFDMKAGSTFPNSPAATGTVVQALLSNNIDPLSWQWTKNGKTILDGMLKSKFEGRDASTSGYSQGSGLGFENSEASYYAFAALVQMLNKKPIYDMIKENIKDKPEEVVPKDYTSIVNESIDTIIGKNLLLNNDWYAVELNKAGKEVSKDYLGKVTKQIVDAKGQLSNDTEYAKKIISILAAGGDPTNVGGYNLVEKIYNGDLDQGLNAHVFGLIALDSGNFNIPKESKWNREKLIQTILERKTKDNGWTFFGSNADPDATAMTISALAPYYNSKKEVKEAIDNAVVALSSMQTLKGGFKSSGKENSNSTAMVIVALSSLNIDLATDERFIKKHNTLIDALIGYKTEDGTFGFRDNKYNELATEQALRALVAYKNFKEGKGCIYKFNFIPSEVEVENILLDKTLVELKVGKTLKLNEKISPENATNKKVIWTSNNTKIAIVDENGNITALGEGEAIIKITTANGKYAECKVNVKGEVIPQDLEIKNLTNVKEFKLHSDAKIAIQAVNNSKESKNVTLIVGVFDKNGRLTNYVAVKQSIESGKNVELNGILKLPKEGEYAVKAFVWDDLEDMRSLSNVIEIPVK